MRRTGWENNSDKKSENLISLQTVQTEFDMWMCVKSLSEHRELYLKHLTRAQASFYSATVGGCVQAQPGIHPFMWKPRPPRVLSIRPSSAER